MGLYRLLLWHPWGRWLWKALWDFMAEMPAFLRPVLCWCDGEKLILLFCFGGQNALLRLEWKRGLILGIFLGAVVLCCVGLLYLTCLYHKKHRNTPDD